MAVQINVLASGSAGNAVYLSDGVSPILLDCGLPVAALRRRAGFCLAGLSGVLVTHEHQDHSRAVKDLIRTGMNVYISEGTADVLQVSGRRVHIIQAEKPFKIDTWAVMPLKAIHDAEEPLNFLLLNRGGDKVLYVTDTVYCPYRFQGLTHILIECNYSRDMLRWNVATEEVKRELRYRVIRNHMSLETALGALKANDLSRVREIYLVHLSDANSDAQAFKEAVQRATGKLVVVGEV